MQFWLGVNNASWLARTDVPMMVSYRTLGRLRRRLPRAAGVWTQDSGGFSELSLHGQYMTSAATYAARTRLHMQQIGGLQWAAIQDWMCEDAVLAKTGLSVLEHQARTVASYLDLRELAPDVPWTPVIQGQVLADYLRHVDLYARAGVDLLRLPVVGIGTVCRRQHTMVAVRLIQGLAAIGLKLHGFGLKITSTLRVADQLVSADSMAWSIDGRYPQGGRCARVRAHKQCASCMDYALLWRRRLMYRLAQPTLFEGIS